MLEIYYIFYRISKNKFPSGILFICNVIYRIFWCDESQAAVARVLGVTRAAINKIVRKISELGRTSPSLKNSENTAIPDPSAPKLRYNPDHFLSHICCWQDCVKTEVVAHPDVNGSGVSLYLQ